MLQTSKRDRSGRAWWLVALALAGVPTVLAERRIVFDSFRPIVEGRLDPNIYPGTVSQHVHRVIGASGFNVNYDPIALRQSQCTNIGAQADKSNYWHPQVYKVVVDRATGNQTYLPMWGNTRIYYNFPNVKPGTGPGTYIEPFPDDFQMVAGSPMKKTGGGYSQDDLSIFYYCEQDWKNGTITSQTTYDFPKRGCTFLTTKVWFPSCWNGKPGRAYSLSPSDGPPNVQYPLLGGGLTGPNCPVGYERRIPSILVETFYFGVAGSDYQVWPPGLEDELGGNGPDYPTFILANGDTTGYGLHADFANGWNTTVLQQVVTQCVDTDFSLPANKACPALNPSWSTSVRDSCFLEKTSLIPAESTGWDTPLKALPGCNLPWGANGPKPRCTDYTDPRLVQYSRLLGGPRESNPTPSEIDLANPFPPAPNSTTTSTATTTSSMASTIPTGSNTTSVSLTQTTTGSSSLSDVTTSMSTTVNGTTETGTSTSLLETTTSMVSASTSSDTIPPRTALPGGSSTSTGTSAATSSTIMASSGVTSTSAEISTSTNSLSITGTTTTDAALTTGTTTSGSSAGSVTTGPLSADSLSTTTTATLTTSTTELAPSVTTTTLIASSIASSSTAPSSTSITSAPPSTTTHKIATTTSTSSSTKVTTTSQVVTTSKSTTTSQVTSPAEVSKPTTSNMPQTTATTSTTSSTPSKTSSNIIVAPPPRTTQPKYVRTLVGKGASVRLSANVPRDILGAPLALHHTSVRRSAHAVIMGRRPKRATEL